jgi:serine/threonine-protein kinase HipA
MAHELDVWLFADRVGTLALVDGRLNFCYASWLAVASRRCCLVRLAAPQAEPFDDRKTRPFFAGLLPEGRMRRLIAQQFQVSGQNDFALLEPHRRRMRRGRDVPRTGAGFACANPQR